MSFSSFLRPFKREKAEKIIYFFLIGFAFTLSLSKTINTIILVSTYIIIVLFFRRDTAIFFKESYKQPLFFPILLYIFTIFIGSFYSQNYIEGLRRTNIFLNLFFIYLLFSTIFSEFKIKIEDLKSRKLIILMFFLLSALFLDIISFLKYLFFIYKKVKITNIEKLMPLGINHIWFGNLNAICFYISFFIYYYKKDFSFALNSKFFLFSMPFFLLGMIISASRTSWLAFIGCFWIFLVINLYKNKKAIILAILLTILISVFLYKMSDTIHQRVYLIYSDIKNYLSGNTHTSIGMRFLMWKASLKMFLSHPIFGIGTGDYPVMIKKYITQGLLPKSIEKFNQPHNNFLFILSTLGLFGFSAFLFFIISIFLEVQNNIKNEKKLEGYIALFVTIHYLIASLTEVVFYIHTSLCTFAFLIGLCITKKSKFKFI